MPEETQPEPNDGLVRWSMAEAVISAAGEVLGEAMGTPEAAAFGVVASVGVMTALRLDSAARAGRVAKAARTIEVAADELGIPVDGLEAKARRSPENIELVARVLAASASTASAAEKIDALGKVLARGLQDDATLDEALLLATVLADIEAPHLRVLALLVGADPVWGEQGRNEWRRSSSETPSHRDLAQMGGGRVAFPAIIATLVRHGLAVEIPTHRENATDVSNRMWVATDLGRTCVELLLPEVPHWATLEGFLDRM